MRNSEICSLAPCTLAPGRRLQPTALLEGMAWPVRWCIRVVGLSAIADISIGSVVTWAWERQPPHCMTGQNGRAAGSHQGISAEPISKCEFRRGKGTADQVNTKTGYIARLWYEDFHVIDCTAQEKLKDVAYMTGHAAIHSSSKPKNSEGAATMLDEQPTATLLKWFLWSHIFIAGLDLLCLVPSFRRLCQSGWSVANYFRNDQKPLRIYEYYHTPICSNHLSRLELSSQLQRFWNFTPPGRAWCTQDRRICLPPGSGQEPPIFRNPQSGFAGVFRCKRCRAIEKSRRQDLFLFKRI